MSTTAHRQRPDHRAQQLGTARVDLAADDLVQLSVGVALFTTHLPDHEQSERLRPREELGSGRVGLAIRLVCDQRVLSRTRTSSVLVRRRVGRFAERPETRAAMARWVSE